MLVITGVWRWKGCGGTLRIGLLKGPILLILVFSLISELESFQLYKYVHECSTCFKMTLARLF